MGSMPRWSAHSGMTAWREARSALSSRTPAPTVRKTPAWDTAMLRRVGCCGGTPSAGNGFASRSGMVTDTAAAAAIATTPAQ